MKELGEFISQVGFPVFVAAFILIRLEPTLNKIAKINGALLEYLRKKNGEG